jgi:methyl-accepting chemotaxis protein
MRNWLRITESNGLKRRDKMKFKIKMSFMMIAIVVIVAGGIAVIELMQASDISLRLSLRGLNYLAREQATYWVGREENFISQLTGVADIMSEFEKIRPDERRDLYDNMLLATLNNNPRFARIFSIWKPNAMDGMDSRCIGRPVSSPTGQYAMTWGRDTGPIEVKPNLVINEINAWMDGPNALKTRVENPTPFKNNGKDTFIIKIGVPITRSTSSEVVGHLCVLIDIAPIQAEVEKTIKNHEEISALVLYSGNGMIMGHLVPDQVGKMLSDVDTIYGDYTQEADRAVREGKEFQCSSYSSVLKANMKITMIPFQIGDSGMYWTVMIATSETYIMKEVNAITRFTIILAAIAIIAAAVIVYFVFNSTTKPIVNVTFQKAKAA